MECSFSFLARNNWELYVCLFSPGVWIRVNRWNRDEPFPVGIKPHTDFHCAKANSDGIVPKMVLIWFSHIKSILSISHFAITFSDFTSHCFCNKAEIFFGQFKKKVFLVNIRLLWMPTNFRFKSMFQAYNSMGTFQSFITKWTNPFSICIQCVSTISVAICAQVLE